MLIPLQFVSSSKFSVSEQNYQVMVCIFLECKEHFGNKIILICQNFLFLSLQRFTCSALNTDAMTIIIYFVMEVMMSEMRISVNHKIKRKFTLFQWIP